MSGLTQVRLQRAVVARLEVLDVPERLGERLLHQIFGVAQIARPSRQTTTRPAPQWALMPPNQVVQRLRVALPGATQQVRRRGQIGHDGVDAAISAMTRAEAAVMAQMIDRTRRDEWPSERCNDRKDREPNITVQLRLCCTGRTCPLI